MSGPYLEERLRRVRSLLMIALAAEQVGIARRCLELTVGYAKTRQQFGRTIGSFQALKHRLVDMLVATELAEAIRTVASGEAVVSPRITQRMLEMFAGSPPSSEAPAQSSSDPRIDSLTPREKEILVLMSQGMSNAEIAAHLVVSATTVKTHVGNVLAKLDVRDRVQAVVVAYETGLMA